MYFYFLFLFALSFVILFLILDKEENSFFKTFCKELFVIGFIIIVIACLIYILKTVFKVEIIELILENIKK